MMLNNKTKVKVYSPDEDTGFFDIVAGDLQEYRFSPKSVHIYP